MVIKMKKIAILGSTGSIGTQTLEIVRDNPDLDVVGLAAGTNIDLFEKQVREACIAAERGGLQGFKGTACRHAG